MTSKDKIFQNTKNGELIAAKDIVTAFCKFYNEARRKGEEPPCMGEIKVWET